MNETPTDQTTRPLYPVTATDALARWDANESVFTIEMGGLGPSYEQCIHMLAFEIIRDCKDKPLPVLDEESRWGDEAVHRCNDRAGGFSGAQVGAAKTIAYRSIRDGWEAMLKSAPDRLIQVSRAFPHAPLPA